MGDLSPGSAAEGALVVGGAGALYLVVPVIGKNSACSLRVGSLCCGKSFFARRSRSGPVAPSCTVSGPRCIARSRAEFRWSDISQVEQLTDVNGDPRLDDLDFRLRMEASALEKSGLPGRDAAGCGAVCPRLEAFRGSWGPAST